MHAFSLHHYEISYVSLQTLAAKSLHGATGVKPFLHEWIPLLGNCVILASRFELFNAE